MKRRLGKLTFGIGLCGCLALASAQFEVIRSTVDGGGAMNLSGGAFELSGTIGQSDAGQLSGGAFTLTGGFWFAQAPGDCNIDGGINLFDHAALTACASGPNGPLSPECACFDIDGDGDVDLRDVSMFTLVFSGS